MAEKSKTLADVASQAAAELKEFQKLTDPEARKKYWHEHPSVQAIYAESNFH